MGKKSIGNKGNTNNIAYLILLILIVVFAVLDLCALIAVVAGLLLILAFCKLVFLSKSSSLTNKSISYVFIVVSLGYLIWFFGYPILKQYVYIILAIVIIALSVLGIVLWKRIRERKNNANLYYEGYRKERTSIPIDIQRQVIARAHYRCQWKYCREKGENFHIHHIDKNPSNHQLSNLIYLCPNHHLKADSKQARPWLLRDWAKGIYSD